MYAQINQSINQSIFMIYICQYGLVLCILIGKVLDTQQRPSSDFGLLPPTPARSFEGAETGNKYWPVILKVMYALSFSLSMCVCVWVDQSSWSMSVWINLPLQLQNESIARVARTICCSGRWIGGLVIHGVSSIVSPHRENEVTDGAVAACWPWDSNQLCNYHWCEQWTRSIDQSLLSPFSFIRAGYGWMGRRERQHCCIRKTELLYIDFILFFSSDQERQLPKDSKRSELQSRLYRLPGPSEG